MSRSGPETGDTETGDTETGDPVPVATDRRVAVIGDIGGHLDALIGELRRLGADPSTGELPEDLTVIQVGDLIHRGPGSVGVVALVDRYLTEQPAQWVQLVGNHEAQYLRRPAFAWPERLDQGTADIMRRWWSSGHMLAAASVASSSGDFLVTHAGLTAHFWRDELGAPASASAAAGAINLLISDRSEVLFRAGQLLGERRPQLSAGPLWASAATELIPSWWGHHLPFSQIHGHTSIRESARGGLVASADILAATVFDESRKHESTALPGGVVVGIDPCHGTEPQDPWQAYVVRPLAQGELRAVAGRSCDQRRDGTHR